MFAHDQESYLFVTNGTLTTTLTGSDYKLYAGSGSTLAASDLRLEGATGHLRFPTGNLDLHGSTVNVAGQTQTTLTGTGTGRAFTARLTGTPTTVSVDGYSLSVSATPVAFKVPWWGLAGLVAIPTLAVPALRMRRSRVPSRARVQGVEEQADELAGRMHYQEALPLGLKLLDWQPMNPEAHDRLGGVFREMGDLQSALRCHAEARRLLAPGQRTLRAEAWCGSALTLAHLHAKAQPSEQALLRDQVISSMREALAASPRLIQDLEMHAELQPFLDALV